MFNVTDDSGFLALVVPATYSTFVAADWTFDQLLAHFREQMSQQSLLIWSTGLEGFWDVDVCCEESSIKGFREVTGPLRIVGGSVLVTNYESLTMAAQFEDVGLPEKHHEKNVFPIADGNYRCRVVQMFDPERSLEQQPVNPDFVVEFTRTTVLPKEWSEIPWLER